MVADHLKKNYRGRISHMDDWDIQDAWRELKAKAGHDMKPTKWGKYRVELSEKRADEIWELFIDDA